MNDAPPRSRLRAWAWRIGLAALLVLGALAVLVRGLSARDEVAEPDLPFIAQPGQVERGAYLALAGNCAGCHTARGGTPYAGGRGIPTPFGTVFAPNLTPDAATGLGGWSAAQFWRALHNGRGRDGRMLSPAFPYSATTRVTRADADALFAFLRSLPAVAQATPPATLRFPYGTQPALAVWRALFFQPGVFQPEPGRSARWNRGAYLVQGLGHCESCHTAHNALGGLSGPDLAGGLIPGQRWFAPSLRPDVAGAGSEFETVQLLHTGQTARHAVLGPMAEVVAHSTQHLAVDDLQAMADYLRSLALRR